MPQLLAPILALSTSFVINTAAHANPIHLSSSAFISNNVIPKIYSCDGQDVSPPLSWSQIPSKTRSLALLVYDPDAPGGKFFHWVLYNLAPQTRQLGQGSSGGGTLGLNSWNRSQYNGPCPPQHKIHRYIFTVYALDSSLPLASGASANAVASAMAGHIVAKGTLVGVFGR